MLTYNMEVLRFSCHLNFVDERRVRMYHASSIFFASLTFIDPLKKQYWNYFCVTKLKDIDARLNQVKGVVYKLFQKKYSDYFHVNL